MKKTLSIFIVICLICLIFSGCTRDKDRAENNGKVTDDPATSESRDTNGVMGDIKDGVSDMVEDATDAVDDILGDDKKEN